jgi:hypothetical protein
MIYILIAIVFSTHNGSPVAITPEFNDKASCLAAAAEFNAQVKRNGSTFNDKILFCTSKGEKK